jgi:hypothetical protein
MTNLPKNRQMVQQAKRKLEHDMRRLLFEFTINYGAEVIEVTSSPVIEYGVVLPRDYKVKVQAVIPFEGELL